MKKILSVLSLSLLITACKSPEKHDGYVIDGTADGITNGIRVYLNTMDDRGRPVAQDTAVVMDGKFKFEGSIASPKLWFLSIDNVNGLKPILMENALFEATVYKDSLHASKVTGSHSNEIFSDYNEAMKTMSMERQNITSDFRKASQAKDTAAIAKARKDLSELTTRMQTYPYDFLKSGEPSFFSLLLIESLIQGRDSDLAKLTEAYNALDADIKNSEYGVVVGGKIKQKEQEAAKTAYLEIGKPAPEFSAPDTNGNVVALKDLRGKATIIDFWASWCGPCRRENPNVVKVYEKYHDKGLEIIGVSLDKEGQKDRWLQAIEADNLTWNHVSNLKYFQDPVAQQYNIRSIPSTYILDENGIIVAKNLRGPALEAKIAELLD
ncbi:TlpA disulfide reductase family protein [Mangrovimonas sp. DI 80]|uniref:TlpA disulfide reductase family protein n=1 Tax=Mangrovimonas sp. DI 80 TaxID=1779330 RepID=UPI0009777153|nr:TlpA disulfide reductase family protein [Mangrovimonas sp. DI 80]OMP30080.1 hypothetical protein BKM32_14475 [Mangrovimonas sp. DI 80]